MLLIQTMFLYTLDSQPKDGATYQGPGPPTSITN